MSKQVNELHLTQSKFSVEKFVGYCAFPYLCSCFSERLYIFLQNAVQFNSSQTRQIEVQAFST